jgi:hypothetical protein
MRPMIGCIMKQLHCYMHGYQRRKAVHLYLYYAGNWNKQTQIEFYEKKTLNLHHNFVDGVQSKSKYLADGNDNIAHQTSKTSALLLAQSADPIIAMLKVSICNSICDVKTMDSASVLMNDDAMNDEDAMLDDEVDELPASSVQELPLSRTVMFGLPPLLEVQYFLIRCQQLVSYR